MAPKYLILTILAVIIIIISFFNIMAGIAITAAVIVIFAAVYLISHFPSEYDCEEQLETEDEINLIYEY